MQTATLPPTVAKLVSSRTCAVLTGSAVVLPRPTTKRPPSSIQINSKTFYIYRFIPDNVRGWMQGGIDGWRSDGKRWPMTPHRARLLLAFCGGRIPESALPTVLYNARKAAA